MYIRVLMRDEKEGRSKQARSCTCACRYIHVHVHVHTVILRSLQSELQGARGRVDQLESFLGGELPETGSGVTWKEERGALLAHINVSFLFITSTCTYWYHSDPVCLV